MKLLFSTTYYHPYVSGLSLYVERLAEELAKRGHRVTVLCMRHERELREVGEIRGVRVVRAKPWMRMSKGFLSFDFVRLAHHQAQSADVIFVNLPQFEGVWPALFGRLYHKKVIAIYHCEVMLPEGFVHSVIQSLLEVANMITLLLAHHVVTYTKDFAKNSKLLRSLKVLTVYPPMIPPKVVAKKENGKTIVIGVAARLAAEKGIEYVLEALALIKNAKLVVAGPLDPVGEHAYKIKIMQLVAKYKKRIQFLGEIKPEDMGSFYSLLDVLVLPSVNSTESFGMVQVEAMMTGVPVVASGLPGVRVPVQQTGMGLLVTPQDSRGIASAVNEVFIHRDRYVKAKDVVTKKFALDKTVRFFEKLFL